MDRDCLSTMGNMSLTKRTQRPRLRYHHQAYLFLKEALSSTQQMLGRDPAAEAHQESAHISGQELLEGIRILAAQQYGMLAPTVFASWGIRDTSDFGRIVFELIELGELRRTDQDQLSDFDDGYAFDAVFQQDYVIDTSRAFPE
jgi:uncharacterized repeat protein (TIGR04138 family)